jgi:hypothetical protein
MSSSDQSYTLGIKYLSKSIQQYHQAVSLAWNLRILLSGLQDERADMTVDSALVS